MQAELQASSPESVEIHRYGQRMGIFRRRSKDLFTIPEQVSPTPAPTTPSTASGGFRMVVTDCFFITGRGVVVTGMVESGAVGMGDRVTLERAGQAIRSLEIGAIEHARRMVSRAAAGESVGLLFRTTVRDEIVPGDVIRT
jgi:translation elongation factor EF-Tu-like GTPase